MPSCMVVVERWSFCASTSAEEGADTTSYLWDCGACSRQTSCHAHQSCPAERPTEQIRAQQALTQRVPGSNKGCQIEEAEEGLHISTQPPTTTYRTTHNLPRGATMVWAILLREHPQHVSIRTAPKAPKQPKAKLSQAARPP
eukprot:103631-Chlamydomonas_euryale.AAC.1